MNKPLFNDTTDVNDAYKALDIILRETKGTDKESFEIIWDALNQINTILDYLMKRLEHTESERFS